MDDAVARGCNPKGPIRVVGGRIVRGTPKRTDYLLR